MNCQKILVFILLAACSSQCFAKKHITCSAANAFLVTDAPVVNPASPPPFSSHVAGSIFPLYITAIGKMGETGQNCVDTDYNGDETLLFCLDYANPSTGSMPAVIKVNNQSNTIGASYGCKNISVEFNNGQAPKAGETLTASYGDAGKINISVSDSSCSNNCK